MQVEFTSPEFQADGTFKAATYRFSGSTEGGWTLLRNHRPYLDLGPGYRLLRSLSCGVCATDLVRHHLPFPLPQITGHEVLAADESEGRFAVEINASHRARGVDSDCPFCRLDLHTHCPDRIVLGIHDLPGGFGPYILAPVGAVIPVPDVIPSSTAVLIEPLAAALHAVKTIRPQPGERIAVLGPRRLGMLVVAALSAYRRSTSLDFAIVALSRHEHLLKMAESLGAEIRVSVSGDGSDLPSGLAEVVIDTTGNPKGLELAIRLARREVHVKSTHGQPGLGLNHLTELVVDELRLGPFPQGDAEQELNLEPLSDPAVNQRPHLAWLADAEPPAWLQAKTHIYREDAAGILLRMETTPSPGGLPRVDVAVVQNARQLDSVIRPCPAREVSLVRPRGDILLISGDGGTDWSPLIGSILKSGLRLTSSRCGDFHAAIELLSEDPELMRVGSRLITHTFDAEHIAEGFSTARSSACIKAVIERETRS